MLRAFPAPSDRRRTEFNGLSGRSGRKTCPDLFADRGQACQPAGQYHHELRPAGWRGSRWCCGTAPRRVSTSRSRRSRPMAAARVVSRPCCHGPLTRIDAIVRAGREIPLPGSLELGRHPCVVQERPTCPSGQAADHPGRPRDAESASKDKDTPLPRHRAGGIPINTKHVKTEVLVENGGTVVIGGIYQQTTNNSTSKVPFPWRRSRARTAVPQRLQERCEIGTAHFHYPRAVEDQLVVR